MSWTFALYMEAVAIVPQLYMFHRKGGEVESFTSHFVVCLGIARVMHFAFWLSTHHELENRMSALPGGWLVGYVVLFSQLVHMLLMVDFFYYYFVRFVDPALLRPGRLDRKIEFAQPDRRQKRMVFQAATSRMNLSDEVDLEDYVNRSEKISNADVASICAEAGLQAVRENRYVVLPKDFDQAYKKAVNNREKELLFYSI